jgi:hypothetical protein
MITASLKRFLGVGAGVPITAAWLGALMFASPPGSAAGQSDPGVAQGSCFNRREWRGLWTTAPDARSMYINVSHRIYHLELDAAYPLLKSPWAVLSDSDSSDVICSAVDFKLVVSDRIGASEAVVVGHVTVLTAAEAAALPKALRPPSS